MYFCCKINVISAALTTGLCSTDYCEMHNTIKEGCKLRLKNVSSTY